MPASFRFASQRRVPLESSEKGHYVPIAAPLMSVEDTGTKMGRFTVSVMVAARKPYSIKPGRRPERLGRAEFARQHGADAVSLRMVEAFALEFGLRVQPSRPGPCVLRLTGSAAALQEAFGVSLRMINTPQGSFRIREGAIYIPEELVGHVVAVLGLDNRPQARPHLRVARPHKGNLSYTPPQVAGLYGVSQGAKAGKQTIGLIELGGGYRNADLAAYFEELNQPAPRVTAISVDGAQNRPRSSDAADCEVMLDIEVCASVACGAKVAVYFAPNTDQGFLNAVSTAVHDGVNKPSVICIGWGGPESAWTRQACRALNQVFLEAAALGVTIIAASGDEGSTDGVSGGGNHVNFPASSPYVLGCGGTRLLGSGQTITSEVVWNDLALGEGATGGGVSSLFPLPSWQQGCHVPPTIVPGGGRGVPDVAGNADPLTGYRVRVDGVMEVIGGTSAVAPLWAGLMALANQQSGTPLGFVNSFLYAASAKRAFRSITQGNNGAFSARPGWSACTGLGSPVGDAVIELLCAASSRASRASRGAKRPGGRVPATRKSAARK